MKQIFIDILAFATLFSSLLVITSKNPVISVVFLISVFINAAGYLLLTGINFIGISYIIIYIGAIAVLFLFVIMMININLTEIQEVGSQYTKNLPLAFAIALLFIYELITILPFTFNDISIFSYALNYLINFSSILFSNSWERLRACACETRRRDERSICKGVPQRRTAGRTVTRTQQSTKLRTRRNADSRGRHGGSSQRASHAFAPGASNSKEPKAGSCPFS